MPRKSKLKGQTAFAANLSRLRKEKGYSLRKAAEIAGVSGPSVISQWESGTSPEDHMAVKRLAEGLGVSFSYLMTGEDDSRPAGPPSLSELFIEGTKISGVYRIEVTQLVPTKADKSKGQNRGSK